MLSFLSRTLAILANNTDKVVFQVDGQLSIEILIFSTCLSICENLVKMPMKHFLFHFSLSKKHISNN